MAEIVPDLPVVGQDRDDWGDKLNTAFLQTFEAVNGTVAAFEVRGTDLWAIHVDGSDTKVGALPVGPGGSDSGVAGYINTPNSATQTALSAQIAAGITGKQDKSSLDADVATKAGTSGSATQVAVTALVAQLKVWARNLDQLIVGAVSRDSNGAATSAPVKWPDGSPGTYTATTLSTAFPGAVDAYTVTYGSPVTRTITQPAVTRDASGAVTNLPELTVA